MGRVGRAGVERWYSLQVQAPRFFRSAAEGGSQAPGLSLGLHRRSHQQTLPDARYLDLTKRLNVNVGVHTNPRAAGNIACAAICDP